MEGFPAAKSSKEAADPADAAGSTASATPDIDYSDTIEAPSGASAVAEKKTPARSTATAAAEKDSEEKAKKDTAEKAAATMTKSFIYIDEVERQNKVSLQNFKDIYDHHQMVEKNGVRKAKDVCKAAAAIELEDEIKEREEKKFQEGIEDEKRRSQTWAYVTFGIVSMFFVSAMTVVVQW